MIPRPLRRARYVKGRVEPALLDLAGALLELYRAAQNGGPRWALDSEQQVSSRRREHPAYRG